MCRSTGIWQSDNQDFISKIFAWVGVVDVPAWLLLILAGRPWPVVGRAKAMFPIVRRESPRVIRSAANTATSQARTSCQ